MWQLRFDMTTIILCLPAKSSICMYAYIYLCLAGFETQSPRAGPQTRVNSITWTFWPKRRWPSAMAGLLSVWLTSVLMTQPTWNHAAKKEVQLYTYMYTHTNMCRSRRISSALFVCVEHLHATISTGWNWRHLRQACVHFVRATRILVAFAVEMTADTGATQHHARGGCNIKDIPINWYGCIFYIRIGIILIKYIYI